MIDAELVANSVATLILTAMMFIPVVNVLVGGIVGANFAGLTGFAVGCLTAAAITLAQIMLTRGPQTVSVAPDVDDPVATPAQAAAGVVYLEQHLQAQDEARAVEQPAEELPRAA
jgi:hypothetical protein